VGSPSEARTISVIVICLLFEICDLEFLVTPTDCRKRGKSIEATSGSNPNAELCFHQKIKNTFDDCGEHPIFEGKIDEGQDDKDAVAP
jgi:hypothetical protein